jgi:hypothetical protein
LLQRDLDQIATQFKTDELNLQTLIDGLNQQIAALTAQIAGIPGGGSGGIAAQLAAIVANLAAVSSGLAAHIAATITHGTSSPIVGTQDAQDLDQKRIGLTGPRYGRAWPAVGVKSIPAGEVITLGVSDAIITAAPFMVYGQLIIDGTLLVL